MQKSAERTSIDTRAELAKIAGVSHDTISKVEAIEEKASDEVKKKLQSGEISINRAYNNIKQMQIETPANQESFVQEEHTEPQESAKQDKLSSEEQNNFNINKPIIILGSAIGHIPDVLNAYLNISNTDNIQLVQILTLSIKNEQEQKRDDLYTQNSLNCACFIVVVKLVILIFLRRDKEKLFKPLILLLK